MNLELKNGYYVDQNNNRWDCYIYTEDQAIEYSQSLINCFNCTNCRYCISCSDCRSCSSCSDCRSCSYCISCSSCSSCSDCRSCRYCISCSDCRSCRSCSYCSDCRSWGQNPQRITSPKIGSRDSQTTIYFDLERTQVVCGCFNDTLENFKLKIVETHKNNKHAKDYLKWIESAENYIKSL